VSRKSENLNFLEPEETDHACVGVALPSPISGTEKKGEM